MAPVTFSPALEAMLQSPGTLGASTLGNLSVMAAILEEEKPQRTLEIGLGPGASALLFAAYHAAASNEPGAHVAIDPYQTSPTAFNSAALNALKGDGLAEFVSHRPTHSCIELPRLVAAGEKFHIIYVDGSHLFEDAFIDTYFGLRLLSPEGIMLIDDSAHLQVSRVVGFLRHNMQACLTEIDLSPYRQGSHFLYRLARSLGKIQLTAFRRTGPTERSWEEWRRPLRWF